MVGALKNSPIDALLQKNSKMAASTSDGSRRSAGSMMPPNTHLMITRTKRFGNKQTTFIKSENVENDRDTPIIESSTKIDVPVGKDSLTAREEARARKEKLLDRLRHLGLAPLKYVNKNTYSSTYVKKCQPPKKPCPKNDNIFLLPRVFECDFCPRLFFNKTLYRRHCIRHLTCRRCIKCNKAFKCTISLRRHQALCKKKSPC